MSASKDLETKRTWTIPESARLELLAALTRGEGDCLKMTWEDFYEWSDEDTRAEWVDGEVIMPSPVRLEHQDIANFLVAVLTGYARLHDLGRVANEPFMMKLEQSAREPDVLFVKREHLDRLKETYLDGPADLAIEVLSPESVGRDRGDKFFEYERAGIPEYWLIDPATHRAEFYQLDEAGAYQLIAPDAENIYHSAQVEGFWLRVAWLWQEPKPDTVRALIEVGGEAYLRHLEQLRAGNAPPDGEQK